MKRRFLHLYIGREQRHVDTKWTAWPGLRVLRELEKKYPDAKEWYVREHDNDATMAKFKGSKLI